MTNPRFSIVVGAINEADLIEESLHKLRKWLVENNLITKTEVVVVTAEGKDNTPELVASTIKNFPIHKHIKPGPRIGKGRDIRLGIQESKGDFVVYMDADLATPLDHIKTMLKVLINNEDVVIGVRDLSKMHNTFLRKSSSLLTNIATRILIWQNISDTQCGFKGFSRAAADELFGMQKVNGWSFDAEILALCGKLGYKVVQLPVTGWRDPKPSGEGLVGDSQVSAMIKSLIELIKVRFNLIFGRYKSAE